MRIEQKKFVGGSWKTLNSDLEGNKPQLVLVFGGSELVSKPEYFDQIKAFYPEANIIVGSTAGEILEREVTDHTIVVNAVYFEDTKLALSATDIAKAEDSEKAGKQLAADLPKEKLVHVMIFSDGLAVNGTALVRGLSSGLPPTVSVTGGLVGDGADFKHTYVGLNKVGEEGKIVVVGFYGDRLRVGFGSLGGWDSFGSKRLVTKSKDNVLFELDGKPALALYKEYLGDKAKELPGSGLLFPLSLSIKDDKKQDIEIVRTLLAVNEDQQSLTFAGDIPEGIYVKLMKADFDKLVEGATGAAHMSNETLGAHQAELGILISCVGRKLVLKERIYEEIEAVSNILGPQARIVGFYSYGEICPTAPTEKQCQLHNQTMTITTLREA